MASRPEAEGVTGPRLAALWLAAALTVALALFVSLLNLTLLTVGGGEATESALFLAAFVLILPASLLAGMAVTPRPGTGTLIALLASELLGLLVLARVAYAFDSSFGADSLLFVAGLVIWWSSAAVAVLLLRRDRLGFLTRARVGGVPVAVVPGAVCLALLLGFAPSSVLDPVSLALGTAGALALLALLRLLPGRRMPRRAGLAVDALAVVLLLGVANNVGVYARPDEFFDFTGDVHQNFFLGPTNDVLHGRPMLVEAFSQYGAGLFYFLAAWFSFADLGYGAMSLISGLVTSLQVVLAYAILRLAGASRPLSLVAGLVATLSIFFAAGLPTPVTHPSVGGLRFLLPYALIALALLSARRQGKSRAHSLAPAAVVGVASIWSIESFAYCAAAFAGISAQQVGLRSGSVVQALRGVVAALVPAAVAVVLCHVVFAILTRVLGGEWPDWAGYLAFLGSYSVDGVSARPIEAWSPGLVICAVYLASLAALVVLTVRAPEVIERRRLPMLALAGMVPFGVVSFTYFVGNSFPDAALLIGLPSSLAVALWASCLEGVPARSARPRAALLAFPCWAAAMLVVFAWPAIEQRGPYTPLVRALPDSGENGSLRSDVSRMWRSDPLDARVDAGEQLVREYFPGSDRALVVATQEATVSILMQSGRANALPVSHFLQDGLVMDRAWPPVRKRIDALEPGALMLTEPEALNPQPRYPAPLLQRTAAYILRRYDLQPVGGDPSAFSVVRLVPRRR